MESLACTCHVEGWSRFPRAEFAFQRARSVHLSSGIASREMDSETLFLELESLSENWNRFWKSYDRFITVYRIKPVQDQWNFSTRSKTVIGASMRDPNFRKEQSKRHLALCKWRCFWIVFRTFENASETDIWHFLKVWNQLQPVRNSSGHFGGCRFL